MLFTNILVLYLILLFTKRKKRNEKHIVYLFSAVQFYSNKLVLVHFE